MNKTFIPSITLGQRKWYLIDAKDQKLGRVSTQIANILRGKNKINFYPSIDIGDYVVLINAEKIVVTGKKFDQKLYYRHSGRPGGMKIENFKSLQSRIPERIIEKSIKGMLPKGKLGRKMYKRLKVFKGTQHSHIAQIPEFIEL
jgi:large subunit ribosomal protein L13|tara:strand:+ start:2374 stop:2805 length:432 start_codon:yes stop_codon:yes gene_type:complete